MSVFKSKKLYVHRFLNILYCTTTLTLSVERSDYLFPDPTNQYFCPVFRNYSYEYTGSYIIVKIMDYTLLSISPQFNKYK